MSEVAKDRSNLMKRIEEAINSESWENEANIPDYILAEFLVRCFNNFNDMVKKRDEWYGIHLEPGNKTPHSYLIKGTLPKLPTIEECYKAIPLPKDEQKCAYFVAGIAEAHKLISKQLEGKPC